jgi:flagellar protein FliS
MLMQGAIDKIAIARGMMERHDYAGKGEALGKTIAIIVELKSSLDHEKGGEIAQNLEDLYDYMCRVLVAASADNDTARLDEVSDLLGGLLDTWNQIPEDVRT